MGKIKVLELFAGIGACSKALERLGIEHEIVDAVEIDKYAIESFNAVHNTNFEPQDITKWNKDIEVDLIMHGSPCQDFSVAGLGKGGDEGTGTRSSLMYETIRIVNKLKPKYVIWENVKNLLSKKHKHNFDNYINIMSEGGYNSYYQVLNSKDYGIPQNRERVFTISIRKDIGTKYEFPKKEENNNNIDRMYGLYNQATRWGVYNENGLAPTITAAMGMGGGHVPMIEKRGYEFPPKEELKLRLKDMLENEVDEKYYLNEKSINYICGNAINKELKDVYNREKAVLNKYISYTINTKNDRRAGDTNYILEGYNDEIAVKDFLKIRNATKKGYLEAEDGDSVNLAYPDSNTRRGRVGKEVCQTLQCNDSMGVVNNLRIRKLTPKECWRLMGFDDEDFYKAKERLNNTFYKGKDSSNSQLYKQAGNSIVVNVLERILRELL